MGGSRASDVDEISRSMDRFFELGLIHPRTFVPAERYCGSCGRLGEDRHVIIKEPAVLHTHHPTAPAIQVCESPLHVSNGLLVALLLVRMGCVPTTCSILTARSLTTCLWLNGLVSVFIGLVSKMLFGRRVCDGEDCKRPMENDGSSDGLFSLRRRDKQRRCHLFTLALLDKLYSYIITARSTYTAATQHLTSDVFSSALRRQNVVKLGTAMLRTLVIPAEAACCPLWGPNMEFVVIDWQALVCTDPDDANPARHKEEVPALDIAASVLCVVQSAQLRAAVSKVLHSSTALTAPETLLLHAWHRENCGKRQDLRGDRCCSAFLPLLSIWSSGRLRGREGEWDARCTCTCCRQVGLTRRDDCWRRHCGL